jgi:hypothetical protein
MLGSLIMMKKKSTVFKKTEVTTLQKNKNKKITEKVSS